MSPLNHVISWLIELFSLAIIYSVLCYILPDRDLLFWYADKYGYGSEAEWYNGYTFLLMLASVFINCIIIWGVVYLKQRNKTKNG
jgi:hypothetical protein